jgi:hypothetical protein
MNVRISAQERDALYDRIVLRLNGIGDVHTVVEHEDWEAAQRLGSEFSDLLRLVCTDLGWGSDSGGERTLSTPTDVLARAILAIARMASQDHEISEEERRQFELELGGAERLQGVCSRILGELGE